VLEADAMRVSTDYDTDLESEVAMLSKESSLDLLEMDRLRNVQSQKSVANQVFEQMNELISLLTRGLNVHLNVGQNFTLNSSSVFMSMETLATESLFNKEIQSVGNARLRLPSQLNLSLDPHLRHSLRVRSSSFFLSLVSFSSSSQHWNLWHRMDRRNLR
jgi:hypothetical protein